jgi:outer membrane protein assembly factor BamB
VLFPFSYYRGVLYGGRDGEPNVAAAVDATTGEELWTFEIPGTRASMNHVPAVTDDLVLCSGQHATALYALNRSDGTIAWTVPMGSGYSCNAVIDGSSAFITTDSLYRIALSDGSVQWTYPFNNNMTPTIDENAVYVNGDRKLFALEKSTGSEIWNVSSREGSYGQVISDGDILYASDLNGLRALLKSDGSEVWNTALPDVVWLASLTTGCIALGGDVLCAAIWKDTSGTAALIALDKHTGARLWTHRLETEGMYTPTIVGNTVYVTGWQTRNLWGFDLLNGDVRCEITGGSYWYQPVAADGKLYVSSGNGIHVFEEGSTEAGRGAVRPSHLALDIAPNPARDHVRIQLRLERRESVLLSVHDLLGREVAVIVNGIRDSGVHDFSWQARNGRGDALVPGIYFLTARGRSQIQTRILLLR